MRAPRYWLLPVATAIVLSTPALAAAEAAQDAQAPDFWASPTQFFNRQLEESNRAFQRLFDSILRDSTAPVQIVVLQDTHDVADGHLDAQEQLLACGTALQRLHELDELKEQEERITARLRSSVQHALKLVSLHFVDETRCEDLESAKLVKECNRVLNLEDEVRQFLAKEESDKAVCQRLYAQPAQVERMPLVVDEMSNATDPQPLSCKLCKRFVQMVDMSIQKDVEQIEQVREIINDICDSMSKDSKCHVFVQEFDQIVKWLKDGSDPDHVCVMIKMCTVSEEPLVLADDGDDTHACFYCEHIAATIGFVNQHAPDQVAKLRTVLKYVCKLTPKGCQCDKMEQNFDKIADWIKNGKQPQEICENLGICKKGEKSTGEQSKVLEALDELLKVGMAPKDNGKGEDDCIYCDYFTTMLEAFIKEKPDEIEEIRELADMICGLLGDDNQCHKYVGKLDQIVDGLKSGKDSKQICTEIGFCPKLASKKGLEAMNQTLVRQFNQTMNKSVDDCFFCTQLTSIMKVSIDENPDQINEIRQVADMICNMLPDDNKCHPVMKQFDEIVDSIRKGEDPHSICQDLGICPKTEEPITLATPVEMKAVGTPTCAYCEGIVMVLEVAMKQRPDDVNEMREAAGVVCEILPKDDQCHQQLKMFDEAVDMLKKGEQPHEICNQLKFCTEKIGATQLKVADLAFLDNSLAPSKCSTCKQNALLLASLVTSPDSLDTFTRQMDSICRLVPESRECKLLLDHYDSIVEGLKENENAEAICKRIEQCTDDAAAAPSEAKSMSVGCLFCEYTAELLSRTGQDAMEMRYAKEALETMCFILPPDAKCDVLVSKFDELAGLVHHGQSPSSACNKLGFCAKEFVGVEAITADTKPRMSAADALMAIQ